MLSVEPEVVRGGCAGSSVTQDRRDYIRMESRRFLTSIILIPAMVIRRARAITVRLIGYTPSLDRLFSAWHTIERTRFG